VATCRDHLARVDPPWNINHTGTVRIDKTPDASALFGDDNPTNRQRQLIDRKIFAAVAMQVPTNMLVIDMLIQARAPVWPWGMLSSNRE
jgi:hypothetical protein